MKLKNYINRFFLCGMELKKKKRIFPRKIIQREINDFGRFCLKSETRNDKKLFRHFSKVIILSNSVQIEKLDFTQ